MQMIKTCKKHQSHGAVCLQAKVQPEIQGNI